jgi:hypothetical protein
MSTVRKARVVTKAQKSKPAFFLAVCQAILAGITAHQNLFPNLPVTLAVLQAQIQALDSWQQQARRRIPGAAAQRNQALEALDVSVQALVAFVQGLVSAAPEQAETLAQAAGMKLAAAPNRSKPILAAKQKDGQSGVVYLAANVTLLTVGGKKRGQSFLSWQLSLDGKVWTSVPSTPYGKTTITGLTALTTYQFRVALTDKNGEGAWSQALSFLVH